nr:hypothetical protein Iba_chr11eCG12850 [Ipomoea batatas]
MVMDAGCLADVWVVGIEFSFIGRPPLCLKTDRSKPIKVGSSFIDIDERVVRKYTCRNLAIALPLRRTNTSIITQKPQELHKRIFDAASLARARLDSVEVGVIYGYQK